MTPSPIAIVGRATVLPGALSPEALWTAVSEGRDLLASAPKDRWRTDPADLLCAPDGDSSDRSWSDKGGYVSGFASIWNPAGFAVPASELSGLDPLFHWALHCAREALRDAGDTRTGAVDRQRVGAVFGNLGFPSSGMTAYAEAIWQGDEPPDPRDRFMSGGAAALLQRALGLGPGVMCLDTACASSLYAIKLACDQLHDGQVDLALAGAVNRSDDLFIHVGFTALKAMSRSGQSRPFHAEADGLVPGEGAGFVALKRLQDARRDGDHIYGVIRGIGLSNDGRGRGFLAPLASGQERAIRQAYAGTKLSPEDVSLLECHATGTTVGDATEIRSTGAVFADCTDVPLGSLKSNMGHLITAAGVAGLIKVLEAMRHQQRPPTLHTDNPNPSLADSPFRLLKTMEPWPSDGPRVAAVSAFGFGGNNAHLLVSEDHPSIEIPAPGPTKNDPLAIVRVGAVVGPASDAKAFTRALLSGESLVNASGVQTDTLRLALQGLRFPPKDLADALPQQIALLQAAREALGAGADLSGPRTGVFVGMEPDVEVCRYGLRWRQAQRLRDRQQDPAAHRAWLEAAESRIVPTLNSAGVVGTMPNIPANRLNSQFDLGGTSVSVSAGEASGERALQIATRALRTGELDAAVVAAVDMSCSSVHTAALTAIEGVETAPGDAAVVLVLKRLEDAQKDQDTILCVLEDANEPNVPQHLDERLGRSWAAGWLRDFVATALTLGHCADPDGTPRLRSDDTPTSRTFGPFRLTASTPPKSVVDVPTLHRFGAADKAALIATLDAGTEGGAGPFQLAIVARDAAQLQARTQQARRHIVEGLPPGPGVQFRATPIAGEIAFVFAGAGSAYENMGRPLLHAIPSLGDALAKRSSAAVDAFSAPWGDEQTVAPLQRLWAASALCQIHADLSQQILGLHPDAVIGYSSGESNSLFATGTWTDLDAMIREGASGRLFTDKIAGRFETMQEAWDVAIDWQTWTVLAPVTEVAAMVSSEPHAHLSVIHSDTDCIVVGNADACERVITTIGRHRCLRLHYDLAVHVPELNAVREEWLALHRRAVSPPQNTRIYSGGYGAAYTPTPDAVAEAILAQANQTLDFRRVIEAAYADGVRVFIEHGPQASCSRWIRDILGSRDAVVVSLDRKGAGLSAIVEAAAALLVAGVPVDIDAWMARVQPDVCVSTPTIQFPGHPPNIALPALPTPGTTQEPPMQTMQPAPQLVPITGEAKTLPPAQLPAPIATPPVAAPRQSAVMPAVSPAPITMATATPVDPTMAAFHQQILTLGNHEQAHIAQQAALHERFLAVQEQAMMLLMRGSVPATMPTALPATAIPAAPPIPTPTVKAPPAPATPRLSPPVKPVVQALVKPVKKPSTKPEPKATDPAAPSGPTFDRAQLEVHASGRIADIFGEEFKVQDSFHRQVRMPEPPLLLADRITGLDAVKGSMGKGTIWSESDIWAGRWYLHQGHIPAGIMIESGQADLMLISWLGVDVTNQNDRVYRLLGCELTYQSGLPKVGDTLTYDIHMDGHATQGDVRLMFFHYDCRVDGAIRLSVTKGQAGFFTDAELADSDGCLWTPEGQELAANPRVDEPAVICTKNAFDQADLQAFADGRPWDCFGPGYERSMPHTRTPRIQNGPMMLLGPITDFDTKGGPWGRGYMKSTIDVAEDTWFFDGHFKNDPCMPGTLMFEGCLQLMSVYMAALGYTVRHDGWRFEPVGDMPFALSCRGQVTPSSKLLTYELFVEEVHDGPVPKLYADLLCTVDGLKAFHARRVAVQLTPGWPLDEGSALLKEYVEPKPVAKAGDFPFDFRSLIACANGRPSQAFGPIYDRFDGPGRVARLPNPPYLFLSRVNQTKGELGSMNEGMEVEVEYDIPPDAWYFDENGCRAMPFAVLLEAALQPCGWLASYLGCALTTDIELCFRNLDGKGTLYVDLLPDSGTLVTRVKSTGISSVASMIIVNFDVECEVDGVRVYDLTTVFGFFPQSALENQIGLPTTDEQRALLTAASDQVVDLTQRPAGYWEADRPRLAEPMLLMIDRVTYFDTNGGAAGLGSARADKDVNPGEWFFKAHFFQDPVQPGSLGIEAMIQLLQWTMLEKGLDAGIDNPRFETLGLSDEMTWKYRGQVIPENKLISSTLEITEIRKEDGGVVAVCDASLWVDAKRIYEAEGLAMRIVSGGTPDTPTTTLDPSVDTWLDDHCPTWTLPALPMMSMVDLMAQGACTADPITSMTDVRVKSWLTFEGPRTLRTRRDGEQLRLLALGEDGIETLVATAKVQTGSYGRRPTPLPALTGEQSALPYDNGTLFHGPAFAVLESLIQTTSGASSVLRTSSTVPTGRLNPVLLDGATHGIPHDQLHTWNPDLSPDKVAYPAFIPELRFFGPTPTAGTVRCEVRPDGFMGTKDFPAFAVQLIADGQVWCSFRLVEACFDKGAIGQANTTDRRAFLRDQQFVQGVSTSTHTAGVTRLSEASVAGIDWLPGTVSAVYGTRDVAEIAQKEHIGRANSVHPSIVPKGLPLQRFDLSTTQEADEVVVSGDGRGALDLSPVVNFWTEWFDQAPWPVEDLYYGLIERFVGKVVLTDPAAFQAVHGQSLMYLGNHQVGVESLLFSIIASGLGGVPTVTLAKAEHRHTWLGALIEHCFAYPGVRDPKVIAFFDREDKASLPAILGALATEMTGPGRSVMVHVEGTRSLDCTTPVEKMSGAFIDMAMGVGAPVVPIRFVGALPRETMETRIEFPVGMGRQDIYIGRPILPAELDSMHYGARKELVLSAINALGPSNATEQPIPGDPDFAARVDTWQAERGVSHEHAVLGCVLTERGDPVPETSKLLRAKRASDLAGDPTGDWLAELARRVLGIG